MPGPSVSNFMDVSRVLLNRKIKVKSWNTTAHGRWMSSFGAKPEVCCYLWNKIDPYKTMAELGSPEYVHLLWALFFLRVYDTEHNCANAAGGVDEKTFRKWSHAFVEAISFLEYPIILWEARFKGDIGNQALVTIDGTDMPVKLGFDKRFFSVKFCSGGLKYEVGVCIATGHIVWINGPFRCGMNDITVARQSIVGKLIEDEMAVADRGYQGEDWHIKTPLAHHARTVKEKEMMGEARGRHETVNKRLKIFEVLQRNFRHDLLLHSSCFRAVAVITQLNFNHGEPPFQVKYYDDL